jgi:hypothetical protein
MSVKIFKAKIQKLYSLLAKETDAMDDDPEGFWDLSDQADQAWMDVVSAFGSLSYREQSRYQEDFSKAEKRAGEGRRR